VKEHADYTMREIEFTLTARNAGRKYMENALAI